MAERNIKINVKTDTGYDTLYPKTKADLVTFNGNGITAKDVNSAIVEVKGNVGTLTSLATTAKNNLVSAINEICDKFVKKEHIINNLVSTATDKPLSANMGKTLSEKVDKTTKQVNGIGQEAISGRYPTAWNLRTSYADIGNSSQYVNENAYFKVASASSSDITIKTPGRYLIISSIRVQVDGPPANVYMRIVQDDSTANFDEVIQLVDGGGVVQLITTIVFHEGNHTVSAQVAKAGSATVQALAGKSYLDVVKLL